MKVRSLSGTALHLMAALLGAGCIASCGGGGVGSGGTGSPVAMSSGTVNGFGSVIVDGTRFDDRGAATVTELAPGQDVATEARLGDRVEVTSELAGQATALRVEPTLVGGVSALVPGGFVSLGQTVLINADARLGPVTQLDGYALGTDVRAGDAVEVHGVFKLNGTVQTLQATRVNKRTSSPTFWRIEGFVQGLDTTNQRFTLGALTVEYGQASLDASAAPLASGASVRVFAPALPLATPGDGSLHMSASAVRVTGLRSEGLDAQVSGVVSLLDTSAGHFRLGGLTVRYTPAAVSPANASLANGRYVQARGRVGTDGSLVASIVTVRDGLAQPEAELKGTVVGFDAVTGTFTVRDVRVTLGSASLEGCPVGGLRNGLFVELEGSMGFAGVLAREVHCADEGTESTLEREGVASLVNTASATFTLLRENASPVPVAWNTLTYFGNVTPQTLGGTAVQVQGVFVNGVLQASKVKGAD